MNPKQSNTSKQELPWWLYAVIGGISFLFALLTILNVLDFAPKPGVQRGLHVIFTGLHEIAGPIGPTLAFTVFGIVFLIVARGSYLKK